MTPPRCRTAKPLDTQDLRLLAVWLDAQGTASTDPSTGKTPPGISHHLATRLVATCYELQRREAAAFGMLAVDADPLTPPNTPMPGDFGTDPASDWPTDFNES